MIVQHPEVQEHLAHEARELLGDARLAFDRDTAAQFAGGEAVLREAMRLKPVAPVQAAESLSDAVIADVRAPAGTRLLLPGAKSRVPRGEGRSRDARAQLSAPTGPGCAPR